MGISLYHMSAEYQQALVALSDPDLPEDVVADTLQALEGGLVQKGQAVAAFALNLSAEVEAVKVVEKRIAARRKSLEGRAEAMREYLRSNMAACGITEIKAIDGSFTAKLAKGTPSVVLDDESLFLDDSEFVTWTRALSKSKIASAIKDGRNVPGAHLETKPALRLS
ncbi:siphovirus Gp157 family protein [Pseudomonas sp. CCC4.4]|uniref:siphovirus Gp157 family protein n=1 Tax=Pseudomonas sp. CCC4.4 TaxID=3048612 RepID=UPI002B238061|nr:siphovirus Gp157 family protein [Pseudomonas sp. CCC4.4]MEB0170062.1 siphovirus Gp157 family protein [Pseudomonas sp. CCC4.4]